MTSMFGRILGAVAGLSLFGCALDVGSPGDGGTGPSEPIGEEEAALSQCACPFTSYPAPVTVNNSTATGPTRSGNICWPTRYDRKTSGVTPDLMITDEDDGRFHFTGSGEVQCLPRCCFKSDTGGATRTLSEELNATVSMNDPSSFAIRGAQALPGAIQFLTGIRHQSVGTFPSAGMFPGAGAMVSLDPNPSLSVISEVRNCGFFPLFPCPTNTVSATAFSLLVAAPVVGGVHQVKIDRTVNLTVANLRVGLSQAGTAACVVTSLFGAKTSTLPAVTLTRPNGVWVGELGPNVSSAQVTCYNFNQSD